ncbi:VOC family protein [Pseudomonas akapageensis]|uniref:VOC family protein n=1 Tax=Pseudomonas akapageensis TaxID=2609961 RepID=UPI00140910CA|nr:VOC family protein [Pseudomonas akapageensis]
MKINPYLIFDGHCEAAFKFYQLVLHGKIATMMRFSEMPGGEKMPKEDHERIIHVRLEVGDQVLMGSDTTTDRPHAGITGCSVSLNVDTIAEAKRIFEELSDQGTIQMPLEQTFWASRFGMLTDRFGVPWMINCEKDQ